MVARQFRVLEAASSSPATSTKNMGRASLSPYFCLWCPDSTSSAQRNASALILQASASSSLVSRAQNYFAAGKAPATPSSRTDRLELVLRAKRSRIECAYSAQSARCSHQCGKQNNFAAGKAPPPQKINSQVRNRRRFSPFFEHSAV